MSDVRKRDQVRDQVRSRFINDLESGRSYGLVLFAALITYFLYGVITETGWLHLIVVIIQGATLLFALRVSNASKRTFRFAMGLWVVMLLVAVASLALHTEDRAPTNVGIARGASTLLYLMTIIVIAVNLARRRRIDRETLLGAISMYLLLGMFFAFLTMALDAVIPPVGDYFINTTCGQAVPGAGTDIPCTPDTSEYLFFSYVTLTTTGYGNLVPASDLGQTLATFEAMTGTLFLILAIGRIVSLVDQEKVRKEREEIRQALVEERDRVLSEVYTRLEAIQSGTPLPPPPVDDSATQPDEGTPGASH